MSDSKNTIINKYRPQSFQEFLGNTLVVQKLQTELDGNVCPHTFLFSGIAGLGKTTLARIIAKKIDAVTVEIDAASFSGVDDTRLIANSTRYFGLREKANTMFIIDECHDLSQKGWEPLLKVTEEPPSHVYFSLCTTNLQKVPDTIKTRCYQVPLKPADPKEITDLLEVVCSVEGWVVEGNVFDAIVRAASGQFRKALSYLQAGHSATTREELALIVSNVDNDSVPAIELLRYLLQGKREWKEISKWLKQVMTEDSVMPGITRYITTVIVNSTTNPDLAAVLLDEITRSRSTWDEKAQLVAAIYGFLARTQR